MFVTKVGGGGGGVCHQGGVGPWASCLISGSPTLGSYWARSASGKSLSLIQVQPTIFVT